MFALKGRTTDRSRGAQARRGDDGGLVLPRMLRRPARLLTKVFDGEISISRHAEMAGLASVFVATALYGSVVGGQFQNAADTVTASLGFAISEIEITGHRNTSEVAVFEALELEGAASLVTLDLADARAAVAGLPWVESAVLRKVYPGTLQVSLTEKDAFAIWQAGETLSLIERDGSVIAAYRGTGFNALPLVVGQGAATMAAPFMEELQRFPEIASRTRALIRVGDRRWNLRLDNGVTVKLPAEDTAAAIARLLTMDAATGLLGRDIASVDLRLADRTTIALTDNALERRAEALKARARAIETARRSSI